MSNLIGLSLLFFLLFIGDLSAESLKDEMNSLGLNSSLSQKAYKLSKSSRYRVVQKRIVDRNLRFELGLSGAMIFGGDSYYTTSLKGLDVIFHINPKWSVGLSHYEFVNNLTKEGLRTVESALSNFENNELNVSLINFDEPQSANFLNLNWYPIYGKLNLFDKSVSHFDIYTILGLGQMQLKRGLKEAFTTGLGVGMWWTKHFSSRLEARYTTYQDQVGSDMRRLHTAGFFISLGLLL